MAAVRLKFPDGGGVSGSVAPWRDPTGWRKVAIWGRFRQVAVQGDEVSGANSVP